MTSTMDLDAALGQFICTDKYYLNPLYRWLKYTDGVHFFVNNAGGGAYWFLDIIGTELRNLASEEDFLAIDLSVVPAGDSSWNTAQILVDDGNGNKLWHKSIELTDCPVGVWKFFLQHGVLMLRSEY